MMMSVPEVNLPDIFRWHRPPIWDPVPDWLIERLDKRVLTQLYIKDLELQQTLLGAQLATLQAKTEILTRQLDQ
jgi:hypothetical protein